MELIKLHIIDFKYYFMKKIYISKFLRYSDSPHLNGHSSHVANELENTVLQQVWSWWEDTIKILKS